MALYWLAKIFQLVLGFVALLTVTYGAIAFEAQPAFITTWVAAAWTIVVAVVRGFNDNWNSRSWWIISTCFEVSAITVWLVATILLGHAIEWLPKSTDGHKNGDRDHADYWGYQTAALDCQYASIALTSITCLLYVVTCWESIIGIRRSTRYSAHRKRLEVDGSDINRVGSSKDWSEDTLREATAIPALVIHPDKIKPSCRGSGDFAAEEVVLQTKIQVEEKEGLTTQVLAPHRGTIVQVNTLDRICCRMIDMVAPNTRIFIALAFGRATGAS